MPALQTVGPIALAPEKVAQHHSVVDAWLQNDLPRQAVTLTGTSEAVVALVIVLLLALIGFVFYGTSVTRY